MSGSCEIHDGDEGQVRTQPEASRPRRDASDVDYGSMHVGQLQQLATLMVRTSAAIRALISAAGTTGPPDERASGSAPQDANGAGRHPPNRRVRRSGCNGADSQVVRTSSHKAAMPGSAPVVWAEADEIRRTVIGKVVSCS
jgi:hypothetical protein